MNTTRTALFLMLVLQTLWPAHVHAQQGPEGTAKSEFAKQAEIYQSRDKAPEGYVVDRSLAFYTSALPAGFERSLTGLGANHRWLDIGAGMGQAILDYYTPESRAQRTEQPVQHSGKARAVALSIEDRRTSLWHQTAATLEADKIRYFFGKPLRSYTLTELGKFEVITDLLGGFSYTGDLSRFMEKTLDFLQLNGSFYTILQDIDSEAGSNRPYYPGSPYLTEIDKADGAKLKVCSWLKSISCVKVTCELKAEWKPPVEIYQIQKVCDDVVVPALMQTHFAAGTPPERRFQLLTPKPATPQPLTNTR